MASDALRILVLDDGDDFRGTFVDAINEHLAFEKPLSNGISRFRADGFQTLISAAKALEMEKYFCAFIDQVSADDTHFGFKAAEKLRRIAPTLPIVIYSNMLNLSKDFQELAFRAGAIRYLPKPPDIGSLQVIRLLSTLLELSKIASALEEQQHAERQFAEPRLSDEAGVAVLDREGIVWFVSDAYKVIFGAGPGTFGVQKPLPRHWNEQWVHPQIIEMTTRVFVEALDLVQEAIVSLGTPQLAEKKTIRVIVRPLVDATRGETFAAKVSAFETKAEGTIWRRLVGTVSHRLRSLIPPIVDLSISASKHLEAGRTGKAVDCLKYIRIAAEDAAQLLEEFTSYTHISGIRPRSVDVNTLIENLSKTLTGLFPTVSILVEALPLKTQAWVIVDEKRLSEVLIELIQDSQKHGGADTSLKIRIRCHCGQTFRLTYEDNGCGIPPDLRGVLFQPFSSSSLVIGTGLGLAIVASIISLHKGRIAEEGNRDGPPPPGGWSFESGVCFVIELPVEGGNHV